MKQFLIIKASLGLILLFSTLALDAQFPADSHGSFMVEISGVNAGYFKGVDGLNTELEVNAKARSSIEQSLQFRDGSLLSPYLHSWAQKCLEGSCSKETIVIKKIADGKVFATFKIEVNTVIAYSFKEKDKEIYIKKLELTGQRLLE